VSRKNQDIIRPMPVKRPETIQLAHGSGGKLSAELIEQVFLPVFGNEVLDRLDDQAVLTLKGGRIAFTTDSYVVSPIFFPGGNIGDLAVNGTVNDLAMSGADPRYLSASFIIEEGFSIADLKKILAAMQEAAAIAGVTVVTGDTKVVNRGCCDSIFINTSGIGVLADGLEISGSNLQIGDKIIVSGTIGDHGMAVLTSRAGLSMQTEIVSDSAPLNGLVEAMLEVAPSIHALRDPTRGGVATTLNEFARSSKVGIEIDEHCMPVNPTVRGACEMLGIDPLFVANEGKLIAAVSAVDADELVNQMRRHEYGLQAAVIGEVVAEHAGLVALRTGLGVSRILDMPVGEQLPRIC